MCIRDSSSACLANGSVGRTSCIVNRRASAAERAVSGDYCHVMPAENQTGPLIRGHVPALDGVRGLAILLVMVLHFNFGFHPRTAFESTLGTVFATGWWGVDLFFALSGFLLSLIHIS